MRQRRRPLTHPNSARAHGRTQVCSEKADLHERRGDVAGPATTPHHHRGSAGADRRRRHLA